MKLPVLLLSAALYCTAGLASEPVRGFMSHRGVHLNCTLAGENSLQAADYAKRAGFYCIETDTRYTRDSVLVIMHDAKLNRTCTKADGSPITEDIFVADLNLEELRRDYRLKASREEFRVQVPTLEEYLKHCKTLGFTVFIEPKLKDSTGRYYLDIIRTADAIVGRDGYVITSNNFANNVIRKTLGIKDVRLMGLLYQTTWEEMMDLGNTIFAISSTAFDAKTYMSNVRRATGAGHSVQTACTLISQQDRTRFETQEKVNGAGNLVNYIATDLAPPDWHGRGRTLFHVSDAEHYATAASECPKAEFGGIYVDLGFVGKMKLSVAGDTVEISSEGDSPRRIRYRRMFYDTIPECACTALSDNFRIITADIMVVSF